MKLTGSQIYHRPGGNPITAESHFPCPGAAGFPRSGEPTVTTFKGECRRRVGGEEETLGGGGNWWSEEACEPGLANTKSNST